MEHPGWFAILVSYPWNIRENIDLCDAFVQLHQDLGCTVIRSMNQTLSAPECFLPLNQSYTQHLTTSFVKNLESHLEVRGPAILFISVYNIR